VDPATDDSAAVLRRVLRRTLIVLGGAAAGTAIAWAISSASASADTGCEPPVPAPALVQAGPVADVVCTVRDALPVTDLGQAAGDVADLTPQVPLGVPVEVDQLGAAHHAAWSATSTHLARVPHPARAAAAPAPAPTAASTPGSVPDTLAERTATDRALGDGMTRRGSPAPSVPFAPVPQPFAPGGGTSGHVGGGADSSGFAALPWSAGRSGLTTARALPVIELLPVDEPGTQPGVTPD
jgi:hypothetical protein